MFTYRINKGVAINNGTVDIEPVIIIETGVRTAEESGITITNETTGKQIVLNYAPENEIITVGIPNRKIYSDTNGDITRFKPLEYLLSEFVFKKGQNVVSFANADTGQHLTAKAVYSNLYTEAMY